MPGHTFLYSPPVNKVARADRRGRARRDLLRDLVADEPRQVPARRRHLRPRAARPLDPAVLARPADRAGRASARSVFQDGVPETAFLTLTFADGHDGQRPDLVARAAQGAPDGRRRQPADGPVRRHGRRRVRPRLRPRDGLQTPTNFGEHQLTYRSGDIVIPRVDAAEPLSLELAGLRARDPHRRDPALARRARPRGRRGDRGGRGVAAPQRAAGDAARAAARIAAA